jgi:hypothetical protein
VQSRKNQQSSWLTKQDLQLLRDKTDLEFMINRDINDRSAIALINKHSIDEGTHFQESRKGEEYRNILNHQ